MRSITSNPVLARDTFAYAQPAVGEEHMTLAGAIGKTGILMAVCAASAIAVWMRAAALGPALGAAITGAVIAGFVVAIVTTFVPRWAPITAPLYAILEGLALGGITLVINARYQGLPLKGARFSPSWRAAPCWRCMPRAWCGLPSGSGRVDGSGATLAIMLDYIIALVLGFFHIQAPSRHGGGVAEHSFSLLVVGVARSISCRGTSNIIERAARAARRGTWSGTVPSACWSPSSGSTSKSFGLLTSSGIASASPFPGPRWTSTRWRGSRGAGAPASRSAGRR